MYFKSAMRIRRNIIAITAMFAVLFFLNKGLQAQKIYINEFLASNVITNPDILDFDDYSDWLELYNDENYPVNIEGYFITDDLNNPTKWKVPGGTIIPAHGFVLFWADGMDDQPGNNYVRDAEPFANYTTQYYHLNFRLSRAGESIGLFDRDTTQVDALEYNLQHTDVSFGRKPDGGPTWYFFGEPTPEAANTTPGTLNTEVAEPAEFIDESQFYIGGKTVMLSAPSVTADIHYTLDGSRPTSASDKYSLPFFIGSTKVVRARVFDGDKLPSRITTKTYFINENPSMATLSIGVFPEVMFGAEKGIYPNLLKDREIPISVEFFEPNKDFGFKIDAGLRLSGQASFYYPQKPLTFYFRDRFGPEEINYPVFPSRELENFKALYLRNSGSPDNRLTLFRDALQHSIVINRMDLDLQAYRPASTFINGRYWGIYNIRDKINADYLASLHNVDPNNLDLLEYDFSQVPVEIEGDAENYNQLLDFIRNNSLTIAANYSYIESQIDINEYLNYMITEIYCDNINWLDTNVKWWRERAETGKWRWIFLDSDWGFGTPSGDFSSNVNNPTLEMVVGMRQDRLHKPDWATFLFRKLLENSRFKTEFIQRFASHLNTTFEKNRVVQITDSLKTQISTEMVRHIDRWDEFTGPIHGNGPIVNIAQWNSHSAILRDFAARRQNIQTQQIVDFFNLSGTLQLQLSTSAANTGKIIINSVTMPLNKAATYFRGVPIAIKAVPAIGYRFAKWQGPTSSTNDSLSLVLNGDANLTAVFEKMDASFLAANITTNTLLNVADSPYLATGDVTVNSGVTLTVQPGVEIHMPENASIYIKGKAVIRGSADAPITIKSNTQSGVNQWGALCFDSASDSSEVSWVRIKGASKGNDASRFIGAISAYKSRLSLDNVEILDAAFPVFVQYGSVSVRNSTLFSDKTSDLINVRYASSALVENCDLRGHQSFDTDAVDYDQIESGIIRGNRIYNFAGTNSDGIDLGETCKNILIENNLIYNCTDKGISVGQASTAIVKNNVIVNCGQGIGIKDESSYALIDRNTFYGNVYGIAVFEKKIGEGGGNADVVNSILARSTKASIFVDKLSTIAISYSLSDREEMPGTENILSDPLLTNDFRLSQSSPAFNAGDPATENDPDGSRADMGAHFYDARENLAVIINEVHYNPANGQEFEFIELYNSSPNEINLTGYTLSASFNFEFPLGSAIAAGEYIVITKNRDLYQSNSYQTFEWSGESLTDSWANITLKNSTGEVVDLVNYNQLVNWPAAANGGGPSLELRNVDLENLYFANWRASFSDGGSPGFANKAQSISGLFINEILARNSSINSDENGQFDDWIEIYNSNDFAVDLAGLYVTDDFADLTKYQIPTFDPEKSTILPHDFKLLWADNNPEQGILHLDLQLNGLGEQLALTQVIDSTAHIIDQIEFGQQTIDVSIGRLPDGSGNIRILKYPTPGVSNKKSRILERGILLVNGVTLGAEPYGEEILSAYIDNAFSGDFPITFWDCFDEPESGYPSYMQQPIGHGAVPSDILFQYSTVIWVGNNFGGDLDSWHDTPILPYLALGGNVILLARMGDQFITPDLAEYLGITWKEKSSRPNIFAINNCTTAWNGLQSMTIIGVQTWISVFSPTLTTNESKLLFRETVSFSGHRGLGVWRKPSSGGAYNADGGQFVFISGRPYRFNHVQLRNNVEYMLENFFKESKISAVDEGDDSAILQTFSLEQNYPNPFNPKTIIQFNLPNPAEVTLRIYNIKGALVRTLIRGKKQAAGQYNSVWDGKNEKGISVSSGEYFYKLEAGKFTDVKKMVLLK
ncbi:MAG: T9SS C-terminal target domain-containing protein [Calditrichaeota bacterium]|nr:MAG: T9SS C-terminal target domain-containing protein [Calditrichota bacterium]